MTLKLGIVMDPIQHINLKKDSSLAMLLEAQSRDYQLFYMEQSDLYINGGQAMGHMRPLSVQLNPDSWYAFEDAIEQPLSELDVILMRKDPPFDMEFVYSSYILELAEQEGVLIVNKPASLRDCNEKMFITHFPQCTAPTLITRNASQIRQFLVEYGDMILKPLDGMGGSGIFRIREGDPNVSVILETCTRHGSSYIMVQEYIPDIKLGDKRILMVDGKPVDYALARIPADGETRGNLAAGGRGEARPLSERDRWICDQVGPELVKRGLIFVGLDVIGDYLTEINVTSPTCIREIDQQTGSNIAGLLMDSIEARCGHKH